MSVAFSAGSSDVAVSDTSVPSASESVLVPRRKVRVLFINDTARNGGPGRSLFYILRFLDPAVVHRAVVLPRPGVISELYEERGVTEELFFEHDLVENPIEPWDRPMAREDFEAPLALRGVRAAANVVRAGRAMARLTNLIRRGNYDLIYCNGTNADFAGGLLAFTSATPALWHVRYTSLPGVVRGTHDRLAASEGVKRIVCVSKASAGLFPHCPEKVRVIHNALDIEEFDAAGVTPCLRSELGLSPDTVVFGSQGRILPRKGYIEMVRAAKLAIDRMSDEERARVHFAVLGDTPEDIRPDHVAECRGLVKELGLEKQFTFLGFKIDVKPYVTDFDVAVVPSVYPDPLPRAVIESMALGKPVIAFDVGGVAEMLRGGETGALVRGTPPDVAGLSEQFLRYLRDPDLRRKQGLAGRARVERDFDGATQAKRIQNQIVEASGLATGTVS
ncbi:glycosyltransferase family 4 protein [Labilithrix luteola]|uniref:glycosyltransferase family 4 protein n=1 Tax=Labilithrix luteola TaxID=1391654 RepID=UPI000A99607D|nr:glycosyltransferase family 4 protein [Labilithrix luteola]